MFLREFPSYLKKSAESNVPSSKNCTGHFFELLGKSWDGVVKCIALRAFVSEYACKPPRTYLCVFRYLSKSDFFSRSHKALQRGRERQTERETDKESEKIRGQAIFPAILPDVILPELCFQTDTSKNTHRKRPTQHQIWTFSKCGQTSDNGDLVAVLVRGMPWGLGGGFCNWTVNYACWAFHARKDVLVCARKRVV